MRKSSVCFAANSLVCGLYRAEHDKFRSLTHLNPKRSGYDGIRLIQEQKLLGILRSNALCRFGLRHRFDRLKSVGDFREAVPLSSYEDYAVDIERIRQGEDNVLTGEKVMFLEPSSGSASPSKLIPYTNGLRREFQSGIRPWIYDLYTSVPGLKWGRSYWSITPPAAAQTHGGKIPVGFDDDEAYFGKFEKLFFDRIFAVPGETARAKTMDDFYRRTSIALLRCQNLRLISVWNPSYLLLLLRFIEANIEELADEIMAFDRRRAGEVRNAISERAYERVWKDLKLISCWTDANARITAEKLGKKFPGVCIQPKGLLATEGLISFPLTGLPYPVLSVYSHFFEFVSEPDRRIFLSSELQQGGEYAVVVTTSGGLYRYQLKDVISVRGFAGEVPMVEFIGKQDVVSDMHGEKLNEMFVKNALAPLLEGIDFYMVAPEENCYVLYVHFVSGSKAEGEAPCLEDRLDAALRANFHYDLCRNLGQLRPARVFLLDHSPEKEYIEECVRRGQRLGNIKPAALHRQGGWQTVFSGEYV